MARVRQADPMAQYDGLLIYLNKRLAENQNPRESDIKAIFDHPEDRGAIIQMFGVGRSPIPDSDYTILLRDMLKLRQKNNPNLQLIA